MDTIMEDSVKPAKPPKRGESVETSSATGSFDDMSSNATSSNTNVNPFSKDPDEEKMEERRRTGLPISVNRKMKEIQKIHASSLNPLSNNDMIRYVPQYATELPHHDRAQAMVRSNSFCIFIYICIVMSSVAMGVQLQKQDDSNKNMFFTVDFFFLMIYIAEVGLKVYTFGHNYFRFYSFLMEFCCTLAAMVDIGLRYQGLEDTWRNTSNACRCSRILLLSKLFMMIEQFRVLILSFKRSVLSLWGIVFIVLVVCYGSTIVCYSVVGKSQSYLDTELMKDEHFKYFGSIPRTMLTLFSLVIVSDTDHIVRFVFKKQPYFCFFFITFTIFMTLGIMNVVVGIVVDQVSQVHKDAIRYDEDASRVKYERKLKQVVEVYLDTSTDKDKLITEKGMNEIAEIIEIIGGIDLPPDYSMSDLFLLLDTTGTGKITQDMFINGILKLMFSSEKQAEFQTQLTVNAIRKDVYVMRKEMHELFRHTRNIENESLKFGMFPMLGGNDLMQHGGSAESLASEERLSSSLGRDFYEREERTQDKKAHHKHGGGDYGHRHNHGSHSQQRNLRRDAPKKELKFQNPWQELRAALQIAATKVCKGKLRECWEKLDESYQSVDPASRPKSGIMPSMTAVGADFADQEEHFFVWNKMCSAVFRESLPDLRRALHHAKGIYIKEEDLATILTYRDALARHYAKVEPEEVIHAFSSRDFSKALELVIDSSLARGADRNLLLNALVRLNSGSGSIQAHQENDHINGYGNGTTKAKKKANFKIEASPQQHRGQALKAVVAPGEVLPIETEAKHLLSVLHTEASQQASKEVTKAWEDLDKAYRANPEAKGAFGPDYTPFAQMEELFFIRNQINNAVSQASLAGLRRSIAHAISFGVDAASMEIEIAYRDALARQQQSISSDLSDIRTALESGDWWSVLEVVVDACLMTGTDRYFLSELLTKVCATVAI